MNTRTRSTVLQVLLVLVLVLVYLYLYGTIKKPNNFAFVFCSLVAPFGDQLALKLRALLE
jgi:hypothetical protein